MVVPPNLCVPRHVINFSKTNWEEGGFVPVSSPFLFLLCPFGEENETSTFTLLPFSHSVHWNISHRKQGTNQSVSLFTQSTAHSHLMQSLFRLKSISFLSLLLVVNNFALL